MIKYLVMDVDGTLTDGKIYMGNNGEIMKAFSICILRLDSATFSEIQST